MNILYHVTVICPNNRGLDHVDGDGVESFEPLYKIYTEFFNLDGEFQIDSTIIKIAGTNLISITKPSLVNIASIDSETETDTTIGLFVSNLFPSSSMGGCCPNGDQEINIWANNPRRRLRAEYQIFNGSTTAIDPLDPRRTLFFPLIAITAQGVSQVRRGFIIHWWTCNRVTLAQNFEIDFTHNFGPFGINSPIEAQSALGPNLNTCRLNFTREFVGPVWSLFDWQIPLLWTCVDVVENELINTIPNPDVDVTVGCQ